MIQQRDLEVLCVSLESSQELRQKHQKEARERSVGMAFPDSNSKTDSVRTEGAHRICTERGTAQVPKSRVRITSVMCEVDNRLRLDASDLEKTTSAHLHRCQKDVEGLAVCVEEEEKQDVASSSDELDSKLFNEANNARLLRNREISVNKEESRDQQTFESSSPEHWLNINYRADLRNTLIQNTITSDKTGNENKAWEEGTGILFSQKDKETPIATHKSECNAFSNNLVVNEDAWWKPISDQEWLEIFKPRRGNGSKWQRKECNSFKTSEEMESASSKRMPVPPSVLAESQQMVAGLEPCDLLHTSSHCSPNNSSINNGIYCSSTAEFRQPSLQKPLTGCSYLLQKKMLKLPFFSL
ncbi:uncharacterized protein LOC110406295 isoform X2 [Numida meleagris]|uniref:uncharacterized protein LOC110406295 isoform X2 n=1 Tax=Numida meleagris TaxID=8996 RepID=UPI000B3DC505|nr:uncharacterized protein LOC110406295 isoform X2 [Numida meleagris]